MVYRTTTRISKNPNAKTQILTIPSAMVTDSQYPFKAGQDVELVLKGHIMEVIPLQDSVEKSYPESDEQSKFLKKYAKKHFPEKYKITVQLQKERGNQHGWFEYFSSNFEREWNEMIDAMKNKGME